MKEIPVTFKNKGEKLYAVLHLPDKKTKSAVIFANGYMSNIFDSHLIVNSGRKFSENGYAFLRFNPRGSWPSGGKFIKSGILDQVSDLESAIIFLKRKGFRKIGIIGHSLGGVNTILVDKKNVNVLALWEPSDLKFLSDLNRLLKIDLINRKMIGDIRRRGFGVNEKNGFLIARQMWKDWNSPKIIQRVEKEILRLERPVIFVASTKELIPYAKKCFKQVKGPKRLKIIKNATHTFHRFDHNKILLDSTLAWFKKWLK